MHNQYEKYLKYKHKYLNLKNKQMGGGIINNTQIQIYDVVILNSNNTLLKVGSISNEGGVEQLTYEKYETGQIWNADVNNSNKNIIKLIAKIRNNPQFLTQKEYRNYFSEEPLFISESNIVTIIINIVFIRDYNALIMFALQIGVACRFLIYIHTDYYFGHGKPEPIIPKIEEFSSDQNATKLIYDGTNFGYISYNNDNNDIYYIIDKNSLPKILDKFIGNLSKNFNHNNELNDANQLKNSLTNINLQPKLFNAEVQKLNEQIKKLLVKTNNLIDIYNYNKAFYENKGQFDFVSIVEDLKKAIPTGQYVNPNGRRFYFGFSDNNLPTVTEKI